MIRAIIDGRVIPIPGPGRIVVSVEGETHDLVRFEIDAENIHVVAGEGGARLDRLLLVDGNGETVANLVNLHRSAYEIALEWSRLVDTGGSTQWDEWDEGSRPGPLCRRMWREMKAAVRVVGARHVGDWPSGLGVFCPHCGWKGYDYETAPPSMACPACSAIFLPTPENADGDSNSV